MMIYVVQPGDTLWGIADEFRIPIEQLMWENGLEQDSILVVGQALVIRNNSQRERRGKDIVVNGYAYPFIDRGILSSVLPFLTRLSIFSYGFTSEGALIGVDDEEIIDISRSYGAAPIMVLAALDENHMFSTERLDELFADRELQDTLIDNVLSEMKEKRYYGLDLDFEYVNPRNKEEYIAFIEKLTTRLNQEGFSVNVDLAPKVSGDQPGLLYEAHDYPAIGAIADTVFIMTYEWGYTYGPPMAVAPLNKVREVMEYALSEIPREKILMGIPNYGYDWTLPYISGESRAEVVGNLEAVERAAKFGAEILYDPVAQSPYYYYTDEMGKEHMVWFEDARSIQAKLELVKELDILGIGYWNLMRKFPQNWVVLNQEFGIRKDMI